jgi:hypothetical protein
MITTERSWDHGQAGGGVAEQLTDTVMVAQVLVAVGDHGAAAVPPAAAHDVHLRHGEGVGVRTTVPMLWSWPKFSIATCSGWRRVSRSAITASRHQYR